MKKLLFYLFLAFIQINLFAQNTGDSANNTLANNFYLEAVSDTIPNINVFENNTLLDVSIMYDITSFIRNKSRGEYFDATFKIQYNDSNLISRNIRLKARGNFRRENCFFPPIHLNFKSDPIKNLGLTRKIKLVTHCSNSKKAKSYILREYLAYKLNNALTGYSFKVRLLNITYIDTGKNDKIYERIGFIIEPIAFLAKRNNAHVIDPKVISKDNVIEEEADRVALFQYMIGNTDWKITGSHNIRYVKSLNIITGKVIPVPYDFDFSGFVGTSYSIPQTWTNIENVYEREYLGYCRVNSDDYLKSINFFIDKKDEIYNVIQNFEYMSEKEKKKLIKYIEEFFYYLDKPDIFVRILKNECRTNF